MAAEVQILVLLFTSRVLWGPWLKFSGPLGLGLLSCKMGEKTVPTSSAWNNVGDVSELDGPWPLTMEGVFMGLEGRRVASGHLGARTGALGPAGDALSSHPLDG